MANINNRGVSVITKESDIKNTHAKVLNSYLIKKDHDSNIFPARKSLAKCVFSYISSFSLSEVNFA